MGTIAFVKARRQIRSHGIFCLEGDWWGSVVKESSVRPALELLRQWDPHYVPFVHRDVGTRPEFDYYLCKWTQAAAKRFPILYLAFHGQPGNVRFGDGRKGENYVFLDELAVTLKGKCHGRIVHLSGCQTVDLHGAHLNRFLKTTGALAVSGYRSDADWLNGVAFEIIVFGAMQHQALTKSGARAMARQISLKARSLSRQLGFRMVVSS